MASPVLRGSLIIKNRLLTDLYDRRLKGHAVAKWERVEVIVQDDESARLWQGAAVSPAVLLESDNPFREQGLSGPGRNHGMCARSEAELCPLINSNDRFQENLYP